MAGFLLFAITVLGLGVWRGALDRLNFRKDLTPDKLSLTSLNHRHRTLFGIF